MSQLHPIHAKQLNQFISLFEPDYFITLNFSVKYQVTRDAALKELKKFIKKMNNFLFGRRSMQVLKMLPVLEMGGDGNNHIDVSENLIKTNWHIHLIIEDPYKRSTKVQQYTYLQMKKIIADIWGASYMADPSYTSRHDGLAWFKPIEVQKGVIEYVYKETRHLCKGSRRGMNELAALYDLANQSGEKLPLP